MSKYFDFSYIFTVKYRINPWFFLGIFFLSSISLALLTSVHIASVVVNIPVVSAAILSTIFTIKLISSREYCKSVKIFAIRGYFGKTFIILNYSLVLLCFSASPKFYMCWVSWLIYHITRDIGRWSVCRAYGIPYSESIGQSQLDEFKARNDRLKSQKPDEIDMNEVISLKMDLKKFDEKIR